MDYSSSMQDDNPAASPWGNSPATSPRQNRTGFGSVLGSEPPTSPFPYNSNNGFGQEQEGGFGAQDSFKRPDTASTTSGATAEADQSRPGTAAGEDQSEATSYSRDDGAAEASEQTQETAANSAAGPQASQQGQQGQRPQQPQQPQFRLVAKITGLERTGKKDPVLRFDVHVSGV